MGWDGEVKGEKAPREGMGAPPWGAPAARRVKHLPASKLDKGLAGGGAALPRAHRNVIPASMASLPTGSTGEEPHTHSTLPTKGTNGSCFSLAKHQGDGNNGEDARGRGSE